MSPARSASPRITGPIAANRNEIRRRYQAAAPQEKGHDAEALATRLDGKSAKLTIERTGQRGQEKPVMIAGHADALTYLSFVSPLVVQLKYRCHAFQPFQETANSHSLV